MMGILNLGPGSDFFLLKYQYCSYAKKPTTAEHTIAVVEMLVRLKAFFMKAAMAFLVDSNVRGSNKLCMIRLVFDDPFTTPWETTLPRGSHSNDSIG